MDDLCSLLANWASGWNFEANSDRGRERARHLLIDTIGCALGGREHPAVTQATSVAAGLSKGFAGGEGVIGLGSGRRLSTMGAILDSGAAIRALDLNDFYWGPGLGGHPSDIFAGGLAVASEVDCSVAELLGAVGAGYELYTRLMDLMRAGDPPWPWDHTCACAPSAALIAGRLLKLNAAQMAEALAIAFARAPVFSALRAGKISSSKAAAPALGQIDGLLACQLALAGMTGPRESIAGSRGIEAIVVPGADLDHMIPRAGDCERLLDITVKRYPCMGTGQAATAAAVELHQKLAGRHADIVNIDIDVSNSGIVRRQTADVYRTPDRRETADHSFYAIFAMSLVDGRLEPSQFAARRWVDPDVAAIIAKMRLHPVLPGEEQGVFPVTAHVTLRSGETFVVDMPYAPGHRLNPIDEAGIVAKFRSFAEPVVGQARADRLLSLCLDRTGDPKVRDILNLCEKS